MTPHDAHSLLLFAWAAHLIALLIFWPHLRGWNIIEHRAEEGAGWVAIVVGILALFGPAIWLCLAGGLIVMIAVILIFKVAGRCT